VYQPGAAGDDIFLLSIGQESDERTPDGIVQSAIDSLNAGRHHYADVTGDERLREAIADYHQTLTGQQIMASDCIVYVGAQNALYSVAQVLLQPGDEVIVPDPYYTTYTNTLESSGANAVHVPLNESTRYTLTAASVIERMTENTRAVVLNSPNNPLGTCYPESVLKPIVEACVERQIWLIMDLVYADIVPRDALYLPHQLPGATDVLISIGSLSKSHRMTGWRLGWVAGPSQLVEHLGRLSMVLHYGLPPFIMDAAVHALQHAIDTPAKVRQQIDRRRNVLRTVLQGSATVPLIDSGHGMFVLLDISKLAITAREFAHQLLNQQQVSVLPCDGFGRSGANLVRIGLCVDDERLHTAGQRIQQFVDALSN